MKFDILIVAHTKDANKVPFVIQSVDKLREVNDIADVHVICNDPTVFHLEEKIKVHHELDVLPKPKIQYRPNWFYQQLVKLFQNVTSEFYLSVDADAIFNRPLQLETDSKLTFFLGREQYNPPYFDFMNKLGVAKVYPKSFINEIMLFTRLGVNSMLRNLGLDRDGFIGFCEDNISPTCQLSEFELYGNFMTQRAPWVYTIRQIDAPIYDGKHVPWTDDEIKTAIKRMSQTQADLFTIHTWT